MMATKSIADMTLTDLQMMIDRAIDRRLREKSRLEPAKDPRSRDEILASVKRNRIIPPPGTPSTLDLLREDR
jgi:hypothetical protein